MKTFKIKPNKNYKQYYQITVFDKKKQLLKQLDKEGYDHGHCEAICRSFEKFRIRKDGSEQISPHIGNVYFHENYLGAGVVAHEMTHASLFFYKKVLNHSLIDIDNREEENENANNYEEDLCCLMQQMNRQFWNKYNKAV